MTAQDGLEFALRVSDDGLAVILDGSLDMEHVDRLVSEVLSEMEALGIAEPPAYADLADMLESAATQGSDVEGLVLVKGEPVVPPKHGRIEWARDFFSKGFVVDEEAGTVDYRARVGQPGVDAGELLARRTPPVPGKNGKDVYGRDIRTPKAQAARLRVGANVRADQEDRGLYAETSGRVCNKGNMLSVDEVYVIEGNVDLEIGHIDHTGALLIKGDVEAGGEIRASGDIEVEGAIESADVEAGGDLRVGRGITGQGKQAIRVGGDIEARFIVESAVEAGGDVVVRSEMVNSKVQAGGMCFVPQGRMVGGEVCARRSICVHQGGSVGDVKTLLRVVVDQELIDARAEVERKIKDVKGRLKKIAATLAPLSGRAASLKGEARDALAQLANAAQEMNKELAALEEEQSELKAKNEGRGRAQIIFRDVVHSETVLEIHGNRFAVKEALKGPIRAVVGRDGVFFQAVSGG